MGRQYVASVIVLTCIFGEAYAHDPITIDFGRDVQPLFKAHCMECHGPKQHKNGFRLDRRRDAMKGGTGTMIGPGSSEASRLYLRLLGDHYGQQMPPDGPLSAEQINVIKAWIDQGANWPDELAGETPSAPADPKATQLMEALRQGDRPAFEKMLREDPKIAKRQGPGGSTPLMYAVLYGDADLVRRLLERGADPNIRNEAGATALLWAVDDLEKTRLLLKAGADVNARSEDGRTPLLAATGWVGASAVVQLLLEHGANPSTQAHGGGLGGTTPLKQVVAISDETVLKMLLERSADVKRAGIFPLISAVNTNNPKSFDLLLKSTDRHAMNEALLFVAPPRGNLEMFGNPLVLKKLLDQGANINAKDDAGRTILMLAASSDGVPLEIIQTLIDLGADVHAKSGNGETALDFAKWRGQTPLVDLLRKAGAKEGRPSARAVPKPKPAGTVRVALERTIPLLQRTDAMFIQKSGCVSCHHTALTAMTVATARKYGIPVDDQIARKQRDSITAFVDTWRERMLQGFRTGGGAATASYVLTGLAAEEYAADPATDAWARYLKNRQSSEGRWRSRDSRPPLEVSEIQLTATSLRALQVYAPKAQRTEYQKAVERAAAWLRKTQPKTTEDQAFQLLGLGWAGGNKDVLEMAAGELLSKQRSDGGWGQLPSLASDAYATGQALVALQQAGAVAVTDPAYSRGIQFLLNSQLEDGSWYVRSRSIPVQPYFESGFPHGPDQWISAAATNWAAMALIPAAR